MSDKNKILAQVETSVLAEYRNNHLCSNIISSINSAYNEIYDFFLKNLYNGNEDTMNDDIGNIVQLSSWDDGIKFSYVHKQIIEKMLIKYIIMENNDFKASNLHGIEKLLNQIFTFDIKLSEDSYYSIYDIKMNIKVDEEFFKNHIAMVMDYNFNKLIKFDFINAKSKDDVDKFANETTDFIKEYYNEYNIIIKGIYNAIEKFENRLNIIFQLEIN